MGKNAADRIFVEERAKIIFLRKQDLERWKSEIDPWVEEFCTHSQGSYSPQYIYNRLAEDLTQMWLVLDGVIIKAVCLTEMRRTEIKEFTIVVITGEDLETWLPQIKVLEDVARAEECRKIVVVAARLGWQRVLKDYGYQSTHIQVEKFL